MVAVWLRGRQHRQGQLTWSMLLFGNAGLHGLQCQDPQQPNAEQPTCGQPSGLPIRALVDALYESMLLKLGPGSKASGLYAYTGK